jgi:two-component system sensor histidine kinase FlrB
LIVKGNAEKAWKLLYFSGMAATPLELIENQRSELQEAFLAFGSVSQHLSGAFDSLRDQVTRLRTELNKAHEGKEHLAARLSALINGLPGGVLMLDSTGVIQECNPAACDLLGESPLGQAFADLMRRAALDTDVAPHTELRSGRFVTVSRRELPNGAEVVLMTDVTESHLMQVFLARQQRLLTMGELAAGLAHQIRTPLAAALLYASQMALPGRTSEDLSRCAEKTVGSLKQLDQLVNDMLAFAHGGAKREVVSVSALLEQAAHWLRPALKKGIRLTIRTQAPDLKIRANAPSLVSAVLNLATNALQAAPADLDLELLARLAPNGRAQIVVSDNGPGVPERIRERIFEPFFTTRSRGNGIGLAIVKSVVEAHAGSVSLAPADAARGGATFIIELPAEHRA